MSKASFRASGTQQGLIENMQILTGQKGDKLDKALTLREAASLGLVNLRRNSSGNVVPEIPSNPSDPVWSGVQAPHAPADVSADGAFHTISITWDPPTYQGHSYAEILRAETDNPAQAVPIGETSANVYSDAVGKGFEAYYWVRFVNKNGLRGPFQSSSGLHAKTSPDVDEIIASATNFAIYNPAKPTEKEIIFGVTDDGKVAILEAVIKAATIQIIHAEKITADYVKAGVSLSAPVINGGSIVIGSNFSVTASGAMTAWSATLRYVTSHYGTFNYATINSATMKNCVIEEDCTVKGTVYADRIVGDVYVARDYVCSTNGRQVGPINVCTIKVNQRVGFARTLTIPELAGLVGCSVTAEGRGSGTLTRENWTEMLVEVLMDGAVVKSFTVRVSVSATSNPSSGPVTRENEIGPFVGDITIPANREPTVVVRIRRSAGDGWVRSDSTQSGRVVMFKQGGSLS